jgi:hypothetical protein
MTEDAQLTASDRALDDKFGFDVSINNNTILVSARSYNTGTGQAYIFEKPSGGWINMNQTFTLKASDESINSVFGNSLIISPQTIIVAASSKDVSGNMGVGKVYFFER